MTPSNGSSRREETKRASGEKPKKRPAGRSRSKGKTDTKLKSARGGSDDESPGAFADLLGAFSWRERERATLSQVTFLMGAGFSKAWSPDAPLTEELFDWSSWPQGVIEKTRVDLWVDWHSRLSEYVPFLRTHTERQVNLGVIRDTIYSLAAGLRHPELLPRYVDAQNAKMLLDELSKITRGRYQVLAGLGGWNESTGVFQLGELTDAQQSIQALFQVLKEEETGHSAVTQGVRTNFLTTNYDFVVEMALQSSLGEHDPFSLYTYHGVTPYRVGDGHPYHAVVDHDLAWHLLKLNGGFEIFRDANGYYFDYRERDLLDMDAPAPVLILPSREQDYASEYFRAVFPKAVRLLRESKVLVIVGYSLPEDDALFRLMLRQFAESAEDAQTKAVFYVDLAPEDTQRKRIDALFPYRYPDLLEAPYLFTYAGGFAEWAAEVVSEHKKRRR